MKVPSELSGFSFEVIRSRRKTISLELRDEKVLRIRAPYRLPVSAIERFLADKKDWVLAAEERIRSRQASPDAFQDPLTAADVERLRKQAKKYIPERVAFYAPKVGVSYGRIAIRAQKTRFGSCSTKGNLNFNCVLMRMPPEIVDYVVVHELCHRKEMNHSHAFWAEVEKVLPEYRKARKWLKENGRFYIAALPDDGEI